MHLNPRLITSALVSMLFYGAWTFWANSLVTDDMAMLLRSSIAQGLLSGSVTLGFTWALEKCVTAFGNRWFSLIFVTPILCAVHSKTPQNLAIFRTFSNALDLSAGYFNGACLPGSVLAPLMPLAAQSGLAITVHWLIQTPNLWLTVLPSVALTAVYGYLYTYTLLKARD